MGTLFDKPFTFDRVFRIVFGVLAIIAFLYIVTLLRNALLPFLIAWLLAYITHPAVKFFQYRLRLKNRILSIGAVVLLFVSTITFALVIYLPHVISEAHRAVAILNSYNTGNSPIPFIPEEWIIYLQGKIDISEITAYFSHDNFIGTIKQLAPRLWNFVSGTFSVLVSFTIIFIILLYFVFILLDYEKMVRGWIKLIPANYRPFIKELAFDVETSMQRYFRGQSLIAFCVGVLLAIGFKIIGLPLGVSLGLFIGVLNLIPYLQTLGLIPMTLLVLLKSLESGQNFWGLLALAVLVLVIVQLIQDLYLTPRIMGKAMGLNPATILLSLSIWGTLLGFIGLIVALPLTTLCLSYYKRFVLMENTKEEPEPVIEEQKQEEEA